MGKRRTIQPIVIILTIFVVVGPAHAQEGYYRDIFIDGGCYLTARQSLPAAEYLGLTQEALALPYEPTNEHEQIQADKIVGTEDDTNGCLLYPDGAPRFRMIQTNGGRATAHGRSLGEDGRQRVRDFYYNGGSYTGTCAGFFISTTAVGDDDINNNYYHLWPSRPIYSGLLDAYTGMTIEPESPLLDYYDYGGDDYIASVRHNGGGYAEDDDPDWPAGTEILARYDYSSRAMHEQVSCLAYKENDLSGRLVIIGSHPEGVDDGERRDLMAAMIQYALAGQGDTQVKGELVSGVYRTMDRYWEDSDPAFTRIGDQQYHHFFIEVPSGAMALDVFLDSDEAYDLDLYVKYGDFAFASTADSSSESPGATETLSVASPEPGTWYVGVFGATSIAEEAHSWYVEYTGDVGVLNGVAYTVMAEVALPYELMLDVPTDVAEDQGVVTGSVQATPVPATDLTVFLNSSDSSRITVPSTLLLTGGDSQLSFQLDILDNVDYESAQEVTIGACADAYDCVHSVVTVFEDDDQPDDPTCAQLGGVCCSSQLTCEGTAEEASDCEGVCCLDAQCQQPESEQPDAGFVDVPLEDAGHADTATSSDDWQQTPDQGCACAQVRRPWRGWMLGMMVFGWIAGRRRASR